MDMVRHLCTHRFIVAVFFAVTLLVPLKVVFACVMMDRVVEQCCCDEERYQESIAPQDAVPGDCCCAVMTKASEHESLAVAKSVEKQPVKKLWDSSPDLATAPPVTIAAFFLAAQIP